MSHNVTIKGMLMSDMKILDLAVKDINKQYGTDFTLRVGALESRVYGGSRMIPNTIAVISSDTMRYDVTVTQEKGAKHTGLEIENGMIHTLMQSFGIDTTTVRTASGDACDLSGGYSEREQKQMGLALGTFGQHYGAVLAERTAAQNGKTSRRTYDNKTGVLNVVVAA